MENLWLLTEERPKPSVILQIVEMYCKDFGDRITNHDEIKIKPQIEKTAFPLKKIIRLATSETNMIFYSQITKKR